MNELITGASQEGEADNSIYKAADLLKTVKDLQKVSENTNNSIMMATLFWWAVSAL